MKADHLHARDELIAGKVAQRAAAVAGQVVDVPGVRRKVALCFAVLLLPAVCCPCGTERHWIDQEISMP